MTEGAEPWTACDGDDVPLDCPEPAVEIELADTSLPVELDELDEPPATIDACETEPWTACDGDDEDVLLNRPDPGVEMELAERLLLIELDEPPAVADG